MQCIPVVLFIGTQAQRVVNALALPVVGEIRFNPGDVDHLTHVPYWSGHEMQSALVSYAIAAAVLILVWKFGDRVKVPKWLSVEYLFYKPVFRAAQGFVERRGAEGEGTKEAAGASLSIDGAGAAAVVLAVVLVIFLWYGIV